MQNLFKIPGALCAVEITAIKQLLIYARNAGAFRKQRDSALSSYDFSDK